MPHHYFFFLEAVIGKISNDIGGSRYLQCFWRGKAGGLGLVVVVVVVVVVIVECFKEGE